MVDTPDRKRDEQDGGDGVDRSILRTKLTADRLKRRPFMKKVAAASAATGLAGCAGGGGGGGGGDGDETVVLGTDSPASNGSDGGDGEGTEVGSETPEADFSDVTLTFYDTIGIQSPRAQRTVEEVISTFESNTGATVETSIGPHTSDQKHITLLQNDEYPPVFNFNMWSNGPYWRLALDKDVLYTFTELQGDIEDSVLSNIEWTLPILRNSFRGYIANDEFETAPMVPWADLFFASKWIGRRDYYEQAGLDPEEDFPPQDHEHFLSTAKTLQEDSDAQYAGQICGASGDMADGSLAIWPLSAGHEEGLFFNEDWSDTIVDNDVWKEWGRKWVEIHTEHDLGSPKTPQMSDENMTTLLAQGQIAMGSAESLTVPLIKDQAPQLIEDETAMWGPMMDLSSGDEYEPGKHGLLGFVLTKAPPQADQAKWDKKHQAGIELMHYYLDKQFQSHNVFDDIGVAPVREDARQPLRERYYDDYIIHSMLDQMEAASHGMPAEPRVGVPFDPLAGPYQKALNGNLDPETAADNAAQAIRDIME